MEQGPVRPTPKSNHPGPDSGNGEKERQWGKQKRKHVMEGKRITIEVSRGDMKAGIAWEERLESGGEGVRQKEGCKRWREGDQFNLLLLNFQ